MIMKGKSIDGKMVWGAWGLGRCLVPQRQKIEFGYFSPVNGYIQA
jgi:hypothetical protein